MNTPQELQGPIATNIDRSKFRKKKKTELLETRNQKPIREALYIAGFEI
jgi:hypothetical protein